MALLPATFHFAAAVVREIVIFSFMLAGTYGIKRAPKLPVLPASVANRSNCEILVKLMTNRYRHMGLGASAILARLANGVFGSFNPIHTGEL